MPTTAANDKTSTTAALRRWTVWTSSIRAAPVPRTDQTFLALSDAVSESDPSRPVPRTDAG